MAYVAVPPHYEPPAIDGSAAGTAISAATHKLWHCGRFYHPGDAAKNISGVAWRFSAVTKAGGSTVQVSLQDIDEANGPATRGDGVADQSYTIANADASFITGAWYTATLGAARSAVAIGAKLAVCWEFASFAGSDSVSVTGAAFDLVGNEPSITLYNGSTYAKQTTNPAVIFICDDGSFGSFASSYAYSALSAFAYASNSNPDENALEFAVLANCKCAGAWVNVYPTSNAANFDIVLYEGTTAVATVSVDANACGSTASSRIVRVSFSKVTLTTGNTYRLAVKPTTTTNVSVAYFDVNAAGHFGAMPGGTAFSANSRVDAGAWGTATTTRRMLGGVLITDVETTAAGGGGPLVGASALVSD